VADQEAEEAAVLVVQQEQEEQPSPENFHHPHMDSSFTFLIFLINFKRRFLPKI
jgi:hypothetical protein